MHGAAFHVRPERVEAEEAFAAVKQGLGLALTEAAKEHIGDKGYDPVYGARPLKRVIQHLLLDPLSLKVLEGSFKEGAEIDAVLQDGKVIFSSSFAGQES